MVELIIQEFQNFSSIHQTFNENGELIQKEEKDFQTFRTLETKDSFSLSEISSLE